jgi:hypothetical protein
VIQETGVVMVHGTPCSGKSTLAWLMIEYARNVMHKKAAYIATCDCDKTPEENLFDACWRLPEITDTLPFSVSNCGVFFVIDDAQLLYSDQARGLWVPHLEECAKTNSPTQFLLLICSGSNSKWKHEDATATPIDIAAGQVFPRAPTLLNYLPISLFFNMAELIDMVELHEAEFKLPYRLNQVAIQELFKLSCGHVGLVKSLLEIIYDRFNEERLSERSNTIDPEAVIRYTSDIEWLLTRLNTRVVNRSLTKSRRNDTSFLTKTRDLMLRILLQGPVLYNPADSDHRTLYTTGICQGQMERVRYCRSRPNEIVSIVSVSQGNSAEEMDFVYTSPMVGGAGNGLLVSEKIEEEDRIILVFPTQIHMR